MHHKLPSNLNSEAACQQPHIDLAQLVYTKHDIGVGWSRHVSHGM